MIKTLSGIRFFLFLIIFVRHFDYINQSYSILPNYHTLHFVFFAVSCFFILSGFCVSIGYFDKFKNYTKELIVNFYKKRFIKLYPLYFITGLIFCLFWFIPIDFDWIWKFLFLYIPMLSPWSKYNAHGGNPAGWFICALFFCYLLIPFISKKFLSNLNVIKKYLLLISFYTLPLSIVLFFSKQNYPYFYHFPLLRFFEFLLGYMLGCIFKENNFTFNINFIKQSLIDVVILLLIILPIYFIGKPDSWHTTMILDYALYVPLSCLLIFYISKIKTGILFKILENKITLFFASISLEMYLIHYIFIQFASKFIVVKTKPETFFWFLILFCLTIISSLLFKKIQSRIEKLLN